MIFLIGGLAYAYAMYKIDNKNAANTLGKEALVNLHGDEIDNHVASQLGPHSSGKLPGRYSIDILETLAAFYSHEVLSIKKAEGMDYMKCLYKVRINPHQVEDIYIKLEGGNNSYSVVYYFKPTDWVKEALLETACAINRLIEVPVPILHNIWGAVTHLVQYMDLVIPNIVGITQADLLLKARNLAKLGAGGIIITGRKHQIGKSVTINWLLANLWNQNTYILDLSDTDLNSRAYSGLMSRLKDLKETTVIINFGQVMDTFFTSSRSEASDKLSEFIASLSLELVGKKVIWLGASNTPRAEFPPLWASRFPTEVEMRALTNVELATAYNEVLINAGAQVKIPPGNDYSYTDIAMYTIYN